MLSSAAKSALAAISKLHIIEGDQASYYAGDESHAGKPDASVVLFPLSHSTLVEITQWANQYQISLVPSGGRTGLSGAASAARGEVVVSFEKMNNIVGFDEVAGQLTVEAGVTIENIQNYASERGWFYPVDYASKGSAQIGGALATNAGGIRVLRYGMTRDWVAGLKAVTGSAEVLDINRNLVKDNAGYDLKHLLIGSEGSLAMISEVTLNLTQAMPEQETFMLGVSSIAELLTIYQKLRSHVELSAAEFFCSEALNHVTNQHALQQPYDADELEKYHYFLLFEYDVDACLLSDLLDILDSRNVLYANNLKQKKLFWQYRELISSTINPLHPYKNDIACGLSNLPHWLQALEQGFKAVDNSVQLVWFGHLGDGNVHLNVLKPETMELEQFDALQTKFETVIKEVTVMYHATASAEHGIGLLKKSLLNTSRSDVEIQLYRQIKSVFDPNNILNPNKIFDLES